MCKRDDRGRYSLSPFLTHLTPDSTNRELQELHGTQWVSTTCSQCSKCLPLWTHTGYVPDASMLLVLLKEGSKQDLDTEALVCYFLRGFCLWGGLFVCFPRETSAAECTSGRLFLKYTLGEYVLEVLE